MTAEAHTGDISNDAILAAIGTLQNMMKDFQAELKQNTLIIANIAKTVVYNSAEIKECKDKTKELDDEMKRLREKNTELEKRAADLE